MSEQEVLQRIEALEGAVRELCVQINGNGASSSHCTNHKARPADYDEVLKYVVGTLKLTPNDAAALWEHWEGTGFKVAGKAMHSWKATASCWERQRIFYPSFKDERPRIQPTDRRRPSLAQKQIGLGL